MVEIHVNTYAVLGGFGVVCLMLLFLFFRRSSSGNEEEEQFKDAKRYKTKKAKKAARGRNRNHDLEYDESEQTSHRNNVQTNNRKGNKRDNKMAEDLSGYSPSEEDEVKIILEFIKGKDSEELMKREKIVSTKAKARKMDPKEEVVIEDFIKDEESGEEFLVIKRKKIAAKKTEGEKEKTKRKHEKPFFKPSIVRQLREEQKPEQVEETLEKKGKRWEKSSEVGEGNNQEKSEDQNQRRSSNEENKEEIRRRPRRESNNQNGEQAPQRKPRPPLSPPTLENYSPASVEDIMTSMTSYYEKTKTEKKEKSQPHQNPTKGKPEFKPPKEKQLPKESKEKTPQKRSQKKGFESLEKRIQISILQFLDPVDLAAFSFACRSFKKAALSEPIWRNLCLRDFGLKEKTQDKWKLTYKAHFLNNKK